MIHLSLYRPIQLADEEAAMPHRLVPSRPEKGKNAHTTQARPCSTKVARGGRVAKGVF